MAPIPLLVPSTEMITTDDLAAIAEADFDDTDPAKAAAELIAAVDEHRIARRSPPTGHSPPTSRSPSTTARHAHCGRRC